MAGLGVVAGLGVETGALAGVGVVAGAWGAALPAPWAAARAAAFGLVAGTGSAVVRAAGRRVARFVLGIGSIVISFKNSSACTPLREARRCVASAVASPVVRPAHAVAAVTDREPNRAYGRSAGRIRVATAPINRIHARSGRDRTHSRPRSCRLSTISACLVAICPRPERVSVRRRARRRHGRGTDNPTVSHRADP